MKKIVFFLLYLLVFTEGMNAQVISRSVIHSAGGQVHPMVEQNIGETFVQTLSNGGLTLTQGFIQPMEEEAKLQLTFFIEGYYIGNGMMQSVLFNQGLTNPTTDCDSATIELHDATSPYNTVYSFSGIVQTNGIMNCSFPPNAGGHSYYVVVNHRNAIQTWSALPVLVTKNTLYNFSLSSSQAYGDNQVEVEPGVWAFFSGDMNQDYAIDAFDYVVMDPDIYNALSGYLNTDLNGDGSVDAFDYVVFDPNLYDAITAQVP